jgi:predicted ester cyclase
MSDAHISVDCAVSSGSTVVLECTGTGTHDGAFAGAGPTGKRVKIPVCIVLEFKESKVFAEREYLDVAAMLRQMGLLGEKLG